ncbi:MAG: thioredoxin domain-containing protein [Syntrophales bacterium]|nr:thioredoxin domain-containing protein [Syntrophales bacterium]
MKRIFISLMVLMSTLLLTADTGAQGITFPTFGTGPTEVILFTDYFCPPCRAMEPHAEPILKELLKKNVITLTLVDVPYNQLTPLYARYFLYAIHGKNDIESAFRARNTLMEAAAQRQVNSEEKLINFLRERSIHYVTYEVKEAFNRYNMLIQEEKIDATPTCVVIRAGKKEKMVGIYDILNALKRLL